MSAISEAHLTTVCRLGAGRECCRYLMNSRGDWVCGKLDSVLARHIDRRVEAGTFNARGDNCAGWNGENAR